MRAVPGPGEYKVSPKWGVPEKKVTATKKNTYIEQIIKQETDKPSPLSYDVKLKLVRPRELGGAKTSTEGVNYLSDGMFLGANYPSPAMKDGDPEKAKEKTL